MNVVFNWMDLIIIGIVVLSLFIGFVRGFIRETLSLASWILAFLVGFLFVDPASNFLEPWVTAPMVRIGLAFLVLFLATLILMSVFSFLVEKLVVSTGLSGTNRLLGSVFGVARGILLVALLLLLGNMFSMTDSEWWQASSLIPQFDPLITWLQSLIPNDMSALSNYFG